jgi:hypothetical protein
MCLPNSTTLTKSLTQDDGTLEAQYLEEENFEVEGPSGMLGLILGSDAEWYVP